MNTRWLVVTAALVAACQNASGGTAAKPTPAPSASEARKEKAVQTDVTADDFAMPALPLGRVRLKDAFGGEHVVAVEVAATRAARTRGLMWRSSLAEGVGMLFLFAGEQDLTFWMRNTLIPLDMVFISHDLKIVGIVENAEPKTLTSRGPGHPAQYVLEVPAGWAQKVGLKPGLPVSFEGTQGLTPEE